MLRFGAFVVRLCCVGVFCVLLAYIIEFSQERYFNGLINPPLSLYTSYALVTVIAFFYFACYHEFVGVMLVIFRLLYFGLIIMSCSTLWRTAELRAFRSLYGGDVPDREFVNLAVISAVVVEILIYFIKMFARRYIKEVHGRKMSPTL